MTSSLSLWRAVIAPLLFFIALALLPSLGLSAFYVELCAKVLLLGLFAMSLDLLVGHTGLVSMGHAAYFGIAAYGAVLLSPKSEAASLWVVFPASVLLAALAALVVGLFVLRTRGIYFIMVTLAFAQMMYYLFHDTALGGGSDGVYLEVKPDASLFGHALLDLSQSRHVYYLVVVVLVLVWLLLRMVLRSKLGRTLAGIRSNEPRMRSLGYNTYAYKLAAFTLAGALAGVAGFLYAVLFGFVTPEYLSWHESGNVLLMVILGGMGKAAGPLIGAFALTGLQELFKSLTSHWSLALGITIILAVLLLPGGIAAVPQRIRNALQRRRSKRSAPQDSTHD